MECIIADDLYAALSKGKSYMPDKTFTVEVNLEYFNEVEVTIKPGDDREDAIREAVNEYLSNLSYDDVSVDDPGEEDWDLDRVSILALWSACDESDRESAIDAFRESLTDALNAK